MNKGWAIRRRWQRAHFFFTEIAQAGACEQWAPGDEQLADLSNQGSAFFIINPQTAGGKKMRRLDRKGQSVLEYVIIFTAIVAGLLLASATIKTHISESLTTATTKMNTTVTTDLKF